MLAFLPCPSSTPSLTGEAVLLQLHAGLQRVAVDRRVGDLFNGVRHLVGRGRLVAALLAALRHLVQLLQRVFRQRAGGALEGRVRGESAKASAQAPQPKLTP